MILKQLKELARLEIERIKLKDTILLFRIKERFRKPIITPVMQGLTLVGTAGIIWALPALWMLHNRKSRFDGILILYDIGANVVINNLITKLIFHRERPCSVYPEEFVLSAVPIGYSFPSGHSLTSFSAATLYMLINPWNTLWALPLASMISLSRAYLFTHYPTDIIAGSLAGITNALAVYELGDALQKSRFFSLIERALSFDPIFEPEHYWKNRHHLGRTVMQDLNEVRKLFIKKDGSF